MWLNRSRSIFVFSIALSLAAVRTADAQECSEWLGSALASALQPVLDETNPCAELRQTVDLGFIEVTLGLDRKERFQLRSLTFCPMEATSRLRASVEVECRTGPNAEVQLSVSETFDLDMTARNDDCSIVSFEVQPRGEIGRLAARLFDVSERMRNAAEPHLARLCGGG